MLLPPNSLSSPSAATTKMLKLDENITQFITKFKTCSYLEDTLIAYKHSQTLYTEDLVRLVVVTCLIPYDYLKFQ